MWSGRERYGAGTANNVIFRSRPRVPDPSRSSVSVPAVYHPAVRGLVPVPASFASHCLLGSRLFPVPLSAQLFPSHPDVRTQYLPFHLPTYFLVFPSHGHGCPLDFATMTMDATPVAEETGDYRSLFLLFFSPGLYQARR